MAVNKGANFVLTAQNKGGAAMKQFAGQLKGIQAATTGMAGSSQSWNKGLSENRRAIQQLGFQMTDFTVQIAGGQNALLAFIQQGGQMLQVFGPAGAIMATLLTVFGTLALVLGKSGKSLSELTPIVGVLTEQFQWLADTFRVVTDVLIGGLNLIVNNLDTLLIAAGILVGWFATSWVGAMIGASTAVRALVFSVMMIGPTMSMAMATGSASLVAMGYSFGVATVAGRAYGLAVGLAQVATMAFSSALVWLRGVLMTLLPYALVMALALLVQKFIALRQAGIDWGEIMNRLWVLVKAVFVGMGQSASGLGLLMKGVAWNIAARFIDAFASIVGAWDSVINAIASSYNAVFEAVGVDFTPMKVGASDFYTYLTDASSTATANSIAASEAAGAAWKNAGKGVADAWSGLNLGLSDAQVDVRDWFGGGDEKGKGKGGGGAIPKVKKEADEIKKIFEDMKTSISSSLMSGFKAVLDGTKSLKDYALDMLNVILDKIIDIMMQPVFDSLAGGFANGIMGMFGMPSFAGGGHTGGGSRSGGLDGKGGFPALLHPKETVIDHTKGQSMGGGGAIELRITEGDMFGARVEAIANDRAVKITREAVQEYDNRVLPMSLRRINAAPRSR